MSDFDEEAERERLRERFEEDETEREATERMSELLLQGATMTNAHCSECGDPVFRYEGQEFCATCERPIERGDAGGDVDDAGGDETPRNVEVTSPSEDARVRFGGEDKDAGSEPEPARDGPEPSDAAADVDVSDRTRTTDRDAREPPDTSPPAPRADAGGDRVERARRDLAATLARFARAARDSESPQAARAHLEAARAAAETLDELD